MPSTAAVAAEDAAAASIHLWLTSDGGLARVEVSDDRPGIPVDERERVFERFVRLDPGRDRTSGGKALGRAITRQIARDHGGDVVACPWRGGGTAMVLTVATDEDVFLRDDEEHGGHPRRLGRAPHRRAPSPPRR